MKHGKYYDNRLFFNSMIQTLKDKLLNGQHLLKLLNDLNQNE